MGYFNGFLLNDNDPEYLDKPDSDYADFDPSAKRIAMMMAWLDDVAVNNNINGGSKFTWYRQLTNGAATTFTPSWTAPHGLEGSLMSPAVVNQIKTNLQTIATHFGWDFSTYPPSNWYGRKLINFGSSYSSFGNSCPGFPGSIPAEEFDIQQHQWPPSGVLNYGTPTKQYKKNDFPHLTQDWFEAFPYIYGPFQSYAKSRGAVKNHIPMINSIPNSEEIYAYRFSISADDENTETGGYDEDDMLDHMTSVWTIFDGTTPTVTEVNQHISVAYSGFSWSAEAVALSNPQRVKYSASLSMNFTINVHYIRGKKFEDIFGADSSASVSDKGYYALISNGILDYFVLDDDGYSYESAANRLLWAEGLWTNLKAATWNSIGSTLGSMVTSTGNMLVDISASQPYPTSSPFPTSAPEGTPVAPFFRYWKDNYSDPNNEIDLVYPNDWDGPKRWKSLNPHLFTFDLESEEAPPPP